MASNTLSFLVGDKPLKAELDAFYMDFIGEWVVTMKFTWNNQELALNFEGVKQVERIVDDLYAGVANLLDKVDQREVGIPS